MAYTENPTEAFIDAALAAVFVALFWPLVAHFESLLFAGPNSPPTAATAAGATAVVMVAIWYDGRYRVE